MEIFDIYDASGQPIGQARRELEEQQQDEQATEPVQANARVANSESFDELPDDPSAQARQLVRKVFAVMTRAPASA